MKSQRQKDLELFYALQPTKCMSIAGKTSANIMPAIKPGTTQPDGAVSLCDEMWLILVG
jgi:hypothetical protein